MELITKELEKRFKEIGDQSQDSNPLIIAKIYNPSGSQVWYATQYDAENETCYGYITNFYENTWGTFSIELLELPSGLGITRDHNFKEIRFKELIRKQELAQQKQWKEREQTKSLDLNTDKEIKST